MKFITIPLPLNEHNCVPKFHEIANNVFLRTCWYGIRCRYFFWIFLNRFKHRKLHFWVTIPIWKPILFLKYKVNDIQTNVFRIHAIPMWETNIDAQYILHPYSVVVYCTFYLAKKIKYVTQEMKSMLNKCKHEQYETFERTKK
jgi:hypothetical protein